MGREEEGKRGERGREESRGGGARDGRAVEGRRREREAGRERAGKIQGKEGREFGGFY